MPNSKRNPGKKIRSSQKKRRSQSHQGDDDVEKKSVRRRKGAAANKEQGNLRSRPKKRRVKASSGGMKAKGKTRKPSRKKSRKRSLGPTIRGYFFSIATGLMFGACSVLGLLYHQAKVDVESWLYPDIISLPQQKIYTAPLRFMTGQHLSSAQVEEFLRSAGYVLIESKEPHGGEFYYDRKGLSLRNDAGELHQITFSEGRISAIYKQGELVSSMSTNPIVLYTVQAEDRKRRKVSIEEIPKEVQLAVVAVEDSRFYEHEGVDFIGVARAIVVNAVSNSKSQGASTITQQIVKNLILQDPEKTYQRKVRELLRAVALEKTLQANLSANKDSKHDLKDKILETYLNEVYLGHVHGKPVRGVSEGAEIFFGKPVQKLTLGEAATLAGIISSPNAYSPIRHLEKATARRNIALLRMEKMGFISATERAVLKDQELSVHYRPKFKRSPWFVDYTLSKISSQNIRDMDISTSLDPVLQFHAENALQTGLQELEKLHPKSKGTNAAIVVLRNRDAAVVAMVGGKNYRESSFNRAVFAQRQVGSIAKPLWAALAFDVNHTLFPGCWIEDKAISLGTGKHRWSPNNYDRRFLGAVSLRSALTSSRNIPFVHLYESIKKKRGEPWISTQFHHLQLDIPPYPSASLGSFTSTPLNMARAYTIFPNQGKLLMLI